MYERCPLESDVNVKGIFDAFFKLFLKVLISVESYIGRIKGYKGTFGI